MERRQLSWQRGPYIALRPRPIDLILFDQRTWHLVEKPFPSIPQLLATALFAVHPKRDVCLSAKYTKINDQEVDARLKELACLYAAERAMIKCSNHGQHFSRISDKMLHFRSEPEIASNWGKSNLTVELSDKSFAINIREEIDFFADIGRAAREAMPQSKDGYTDEMLGLNCYNQYYSP